jgi:hypothetical protein
MGRSPPNQLHRHALTLIHHDDLDQTATDSRVARAITAALRSPRRRVIGHYACVAAVDVLRSVVRAEEPPESLTTLGFAIEGEAHNLRIDYPAGRAEIHTFPLTDLATGFVRAWATGTDFSRWASVVVMTDWIDVDDIDTGDGRTLWDAVWSLAGGDDVADEILGLARRLSGA